MFRTYQELELRVALSRKCDYVEACNELAVILRGAYIKVPKNLQALLFEDTLVAFQRLPEADTSERILAANLLLQAAEASLPKQKKAKAGSEFRHAMVTLHRRSKIRPQETEPIQLMNDTLIRVFGFLDVRSLVAVRLVCRSWNLAAKDNTLWQEKYHKYIIDCPPDRAFAKQSMANVPVDESRTQNLDMQIPELRVHTDWYHAFKNAYRAHPSRVFMSNRAYCQICKMAIWLDNRDLSPDNRILNVKHQHRMKPMLPDQILHFLLAKSMETSSSSSSDSDSGGLIVDRRYSKLWAYPKLLNSL